MDFRDTLIELEDEPEDITNYVITSYKQGTIDSDSIVKLVEPDGLPISTFEAITDGIVVLINDYLRDKLGTKDLLVSAEYLDKITPFPYPKALVRYGDNAIIATYMRDEYLEVVDDDFDAAVRVVFTYIYEAAHYSRQHVERMIKLATVVTGEITGDLFANYLVFYEHNKLITDVLYDKSDPDDVVQAIREYYWVDKDRRNTAINELNYLRSTR